MKKFSLSKIVSLALVCAMLMGAFMFTTVSAEDAGTTLEIVSQNVFFDEKLELMFAFNAPTKPTSVTASVNGESVGVVLYEENPTQDGVKVADYAYKVVQGVVPHAIDTVVTFTVTCNGTTVSKDYSVLQYIYERMYVSAKKAEGAELEMLQALLAYADAASIFFNTTDDDETNNDKNIADLVYVNATDCTFDGKTSSMIAAGETVYFETDLVAGSGYVVNFVITNLENDAVTKLDVNTMTENGYKVTSAVSVEAVVEESNEGKVVVQLAEFALGANGSAVHKDGSTAKTTYSETVDGYTLSITGGDKMYPASTDAKGNSCLKFGTGSAAGKMGFTVPDNVTEVVIYVAKYKTNNATVTINGTATTLTKNSNDGAYDVITIDTTTTKTISFTVSSGYRCMVNTIVFNGYAE